MLSKEEANSFLARELYEDMEHLDPSNAPGWEELSSREREFYMLCVSHLLDHRKEVLAVMGLADDDLINRRLAGCK